MHVLYGWAGGIRTPECQDQNLVPYRLATAHHRVAPLYCTMLARVDQ